MPYYNYKCNNCGFEDEFLISYKDSNNIFCPKCNNKLIKEFPCPSKPIFKGSGFYETDYKKQKEKRK